MQLNVKYDNIRWYSIICVAIPGILPYLHIHLTTTHLNPNRRCHLPVPGLTWASNSMYGSKLVI